MNNKKILYADEPYPIIEVRPGEYTRPRTGQPGGGVQISAIGQDESCEAYTLADRYMAEYFPKWYGRYPAALKKPENYFHFEGEKAGLFRWNTGEGGKLSDPAGVQKMQPEEVLELLFGMPANG